MVALSTLALTASFVGFVALARGAVVGTPGRLPFYALASALAFVAGVVYFEESRRPRAASLRRAACVAGATLFLVGFGGEGVVHAAADPAAVLGTRLFAYLLSAGLIGAGVGYWGWRNWATLRPARLADAF